MQATFGSQGMDASRTRMSQDGCVPHWTVLGQMWAALGLAQLWSKAEFCLHSVVHQLPSGTQSYGVEVGQMLMMPLELKWCHTSNSALVQITNVNAADQFKSGLDHRCNCCRSWKKQFKDYPFRKLWSGSGIINILQNVLDKQPDLYSIQEWQFAVCALKKKYNQASKSANPQAFKQGVISEGTVMWDQMWNHPNKMLDYHKLSPLKSKYMCIVRVYLLLNQHDFYTSPSYETETKHKTTKL